MVDLATKTILHDKLRFGITVAGVAFAVALVLFQVGLFLGLLDNASVTIEHAGADLWIMSKNTPNVDFAQPFPETRVERVRSVPGVENAGNLIVSFMVLSLPSGAQEGALVYAPEDFHAWSLPWKVTAGDVDDLRRGPYFFLDESSVKRFGAFDVGQYREVVGHRLKILGSTRDAKSFTTTPILFMDYALAQSLNPGTLRGGTTYILVKVAPGADVEAVRREIQARLPHNDVLTTAEWAAQSRSYWVKSTGLGLNMVLTIFLGVLVGIVVVAQTLYTSTMEHLKEFGTVKAIGGSNADIYGILGKQAAISAVVGFVAGVVPSMLARGPIAKSGLQLIVPLPLLGIVLVGTIAFCLLAALLSFRKVAAIDPGLVFRG